MLVMNIDIVFEIVIDIDIVDTDIVDTDTDVDVVIVIVFDIVFLLFVSSPPAPRLVRAAGKLEEAEPLQRRAVEIGEKVLGSNSPDLATWVNNLGRLLMVRGSRGYRSDSHWRLYFGRCGSLVCLGWFWWGSWVI